MVRKSHLAACIAVVAVLCMLCMLSQTSFASEASPDPFAYAIQVDLSDGEYEVDVALEGGSGRAGIASPTRMRVERGRAVLTVVWSSPNYDYMLVAGQRFLPTNKDGNSTFIIPVLAAEGSFEITADTTAMSVPHEIDYQLTVDFGRVRSGSPQGFMIILLSVVVAGVGFGFTVARRRSWECMRNTSKP